MIDMHHRLAGAAVALALVAAASPTLAQQPPTPAPATVAQVRQLGGELARVRDRIKALTAELKVLSDQAQVAAAVRAEADATARTRTERVEDRAARLESGLVALEGGGVASLRQALDLVGQRVEGFERELASVGRRTVAAEDSTVALRQALERQAARADALARELATVTAAEAGLRQIVERQSERTEEATATLRQALERQAQRADALARELAAVQQKAETAAAAEAGLRQLVERMAERIERLDRDGAERARVMAGATDALGDRLREIGNGFTDRTGRLERDMAALAQQQASTTGTAENLRDRVRLYTEGLAERTGKLEKDLAALAQQHTATAADVQLERLLAAAVHLAATVQEPRPFGRELAYVRQLAEGVPGLGAAISELQVHAARGAPTLVELRAAFRNIAPTIVASAPEGGDGWFGAATRWASDAAARIGVGEARPPSPTRAVVGAVEAHLARGQLPQAVAALGPVDALGIGPAATWLMLARSRVAVDQAATDLVNRAMAFSLTR